MKKILALLLVVTACFSLFSVNAFATSGNTSAATAVTVGNEELTGHLPDKSSVRWYKFENKTKGDVVVYLNNTDGIDNVWRVHLFDSTATKELSFTNCEGVTFNKAYESLDAGTYYLKVTIGGTYQHASYDNLNYTIRVKTVADVNIAPDENGVFVFTEPGQDMFILDGRIYSKNGSGFTVVAKGFDYNGDPYIMLVGETEEDIRFFESTPDFTKFTIEKKFIYERDEEYHYRIFRLYSKELMTDLYVCNQGEKTKYAEDNAYELMNLYSGKKADENKDSLWRELEKDYGPLVVLGIGVGGFIAVAIIVVIIKSIAEAIDNKKRKKQRRKYYPPATDNYTPPKSTGSSDDVMDMKIAKDVINNIGGTDGI